MIRQPTSFSQAYAWHRRAIAGLPVDRHDGLPEAGFYRMRKVKGGPFVPVRIWIEAEMDPVTGDLIAPERFRAEVEGLPADPEGIWTYLHPISRDEFDALIEMHRSNDAMAATMVAMDLSQTPTLPPRRQQ